MNLLHELPMQLPHFDKYGECERCRKTCPVSKTGICQKCLEYLIVMRGDEYYRNKALKRIAQAENGAIQFACRILRGKTAQNEPEVASRIEKRARKDEQQEQARLKRIIEAAPKELTQQRAKAAYVSEIVAVTDELLAKLRERPELLYELEPRKFEEVIAELMGRIGFIDVQLTPQSRDGGRDVFAKLAVPTGTLYVITECKRFAPRRPVGIAIVERFLFTIRDHDRATYGMLATTSYFSRDASARAKEYKAQLHLAQFEQIKGWLNKAGAWSKTDTGKIWIPPTV